MSSNRLLVTLLIIYFSTLLTPTTAQDSGVEIDEEPTLDRRQLGNRKLRKPFLDDMSGRNDEDKSSVINSIFSLLKSFGTNGTEFNFNQIPAELRKMTKPKVSPKLRTASIKMRKTKVKSARAKKVEKEDRIAGRKDTRLHGRVDSRERNDLENKSVRKDNRKSLRKSLKDKKTKDNKSVKTLVKSVMQQSKQKGKKKAHGKTQKKANNKKNKKKQIKEKVREKKKDSKSKRTSQKSSAKKRKKGRGKKTRRVREAGSFDPHEHGGMEEEEIPTAQVKAPVSAPDGSQGRSGVIQMFDLGSLKTQRAPANLPIPLSLQPLSNIDLQTVMSGGITVLILSLWITLLVHLFQAGNRRTDYDDYEYYQDPGYAYVKPSLGDRVARVFHTFNTNSFNRIVDSLDPRPSISRMGEGAVSSVGGLVSGSLLQGAGLVSEVSDSLSYLPSGLLDTGVEAISRSVGEIDYQECLLQAICYISAPESGGLYQEFTRMFKSSFEGRKKKNKKNKKKNKKKRLVVLDEIGENNIEISHDKVDQEDKIPVYEDDIEEEEEDDDSADLVGSNCEVFECAPVEFGRNLYVLYTKVNQIL